MRMKPKTLAGLIILFLFLALIPPVSGDGWPEEQTRHIIEHPAYTGTDGDMFVTGSGLGFSSSLVTVLDPNMDIYGYLFFKDIKLNSYFYLENATLRLHTASTLDFDNESSFTIYGIPDYRYFGMGDWGYGSPAEIMNAPLTSAYVTYNSSQFYGGQWWDIDVTNIVQELKSNPYYEGPGLSYYDPGDNMGFIILGAGGYDSRWFYDVSVGNGYEAQLHLHWDFSPPLPPEPPIPKPVFVETYGANYTIWYIPFFGPDYVFTNGTESPYAVLYNYIGNTGEPVLISNSEYPSATGNYNQDKLVNTSNGVFYTVYPRKLDDNYQIYVKRSLDNGTTWTGETRISTYAGMADYDQRFPTIAVDSSDYLHVAWQGKATGFTVADQIWYSKNTTSWSAPIRISSDANMVNFDQTPPHIAVDSNDYLHLSWGGGTTVYSGLRDQIWYSKYVASWSAPLRISTKAGMDTGYQSGPSIAVDSSDYLHMTWRGNATGFPHREVWYSKYVASWSAPFRISTYAGMENYDAGQGGAIGIGSNDFLHMVFRSKATGFTIQDQVWYVKYNTSWVEPVRLSTYAGMEDYWQVSCDIAIDSSNQIHVVWQGKATNYTDADKVWYSKYTDSWAIYCIQQIGKNAVPNIRWSNWPTTMVYREAPGTYFVTDENGTIIVDDLDSEEDAEDWIDDYDPDPEDPNPGGEWDTGPGGETGAFTRFRMRLWFLIIGFGCFFGPIMFFAWRRPSGYYLMAGSIVMLIGLGLMLSIGQV